MITDKITVLNIHCSHTLNDVSSRRRHHHWKHFPHCSVCDILCVSPVTLHLTSILHQLWLKMMNLQAAQSRGLSYWRMIAAQSGFTFGIQLAYYKRNLSELIKCDFALWSNSEASFCPPLNATSPLKQNTSSQILHVTQWQQKSLNISIACEQEKLFHRMYVKQ